MVPATKTERSSLLVKVQVLKTSYKFLFKNHLKHFRGPGPPPPAKVCTLYACVCLRPAFPLCGPEQGTVIIFEKTKEMDPQ